MDEQYSSEEIDHISDASKSAYSNDSESETQVFPTTETDFTGYNYGRDSPQFADDYWPSFDNSPKNSPSKKLASPEPQISAPENSTRPARAKRSSNKLATKIKEPVKPPVAPKRSRKLKAPVIKKAKGKRSLPDSEKLSSFILIGDDSEHSHDENHYYEAPLRNSGNPEYDNFLPSPGPPPKKRKPRHNRKASEKYSIENLIKEKIITTQPSFVVSEEEINMLLEGACEFKEDYRVEECVPLLADDMDDDPTSQLQRIFKEGQEQIREAVCRFFQVPKTFPHIKPEESYLTASYLSICSIQPSHLTDKDTSRLSQLVLYHHCPEVVTGAYRALSNGLRCNSTLQLQLVDFVQSYLTTLGAIQQGIEARNGTSLIPHLFCSLPSGVRKGASIYYIAYDNFSYFLELVLIELELRPSSTQLLSQFCRWSLLMLMDDQMIVFALSLEKLFLVCFEMLFQEDPAMANELLLSVASNVSSHEQNYVKVAMLAQTLLLDSFPVMSQAPQISLILQKARSHLASLFLENSFNPLTLPSQMKMELSNCLLDSILGLINSNEDAAKPLKITPKTDYPHLICQISFLHHILNPAFFSPELLSTLEALSKFLQNLNGQIADGGDSKMERSEAKDRLQQLYLRLQYYIQRASSEKESMNPTPRKKKNS